MITIARYWMPWKIVAKTKASSGPRTRNQTPLETTVMIDSSGIGPLRARQTLTNSNTGLIAAAPNRIEPSVARAETNPSPAAIEAGTSQSRPTSGPVVKL